MTLTNHPNSSAKIPHDQLVTMMNAFRAATRLAPRVATRQSALLINKATVQGKRVINEKNKKILAQRKVATVSISKGLVALQYYFYVLASFCAAST
jgi:hypothetical protein